MLPKGIQSISELCVPPTFSVREVMEQMNVTRVGIALVVVEDNVLVGTVTDGDLRRAMLASVDFDGSVQQLLDRKSLAGTSDPVVAQVGISHADLLAMLQESCVSHLPIVDVKMRVVGLATRSEFLPDPTVKTQAVIMAGGFGTRLQPLCDEIPKPMLPVGERPLMELIIERLRDSGIKQVNVSTHYKREKIMSHFGNGGDFGVEISYVEEDSPLGTAGAIGLMKTPEETLLVMNGDILTHVDFRAMSFFHQEHKADFTVAVRAYDVEVPYGVIECEDIWAFALTEKPKQTHFINAGIYLLEPAVHQYIPKGRHFDMTDLIQCLITNKKRVATFPIQEYWVDIGQHADYARAKEYIEGKGTL